MKEKHVFHYFGPFMRRQEVWLNRMAQRGWRLSKIGKIRYTFTPCPPGAYEYRVKFVGHLSSSRMQTYRSFLQERGYRVLTKNINLNWSLGKIRWRPYGEGLGQLATSPGSYQKELLLMEKAADGSTWPVFPPALGVKC